MTSLELKLPERSEKPRMNGRTQILDKGLGLQGVADILEVAHPYVDLSKLGWGTAVITGNLSEKISLYREFGVEVCLGGTLFELAYLQGKVDEYASYVAGHGLTHVEISDGTIVMPHDEKLEIIARFAEEFTVLSEVGSKDAAAIVTPAKWVTAIRQELAAGASHVILEGRESGTAGMYRPTGEIRMGLVDEVLDAGIGVEHLIFEAPTKSSQVWLIRHIGPHLNFGNIRPDDALSLETLRLGLRGDTMLDIHG